MGTFDRDLIEYQGVGLMDSKDCVLSATTSFKQATRDVNLYVLEEKPDREQVVKVFIEKRL